MPRIRSIKPEIWMSPQVMNLSRDARLLFIGLITQADDEGRGAADHRRLKAAIFGGDDVTSSNVRRWLDEIVGQSLAVIYQGNGHGLLYELPSFKSHQRIDRPKKSTYPEPDRRLIDEASTIDRRGSEGSEGSERIGKDRRDRIPTRARESGNPVEGFARVQGAYPKFTGRQDWLAAEHHCHVRLEEGLTWIDLHAAVERYAAFVSAGGVSGPKYVLTPAKFFSGADKPWLQPWTPPPSKAEQRLEGNIAAAAAAKQRLFGSSS